MGYHSSSVNSKAKNYLLSICEQTKRQTKISKTERFFTMAPITNSQAEFTTYKICFARKYEII